MKNQLTRDPPGPLGPVGAALTSLGVVAEAADRACEAYWQKYADHPEVRWDLDESYRSAQNNLSGSISAAYSAAKLNDDAWRNEPAPSRGDWDPNTSDLTGRITERRSTFHSKCIKHIEQLMPRLRLAEIAEQQQRDDEAERKRTAETYESRKHQLSVISLLIGLAGVSNPSCTAIAEYITPFATSNDAVGTHTEGTFTLDGLMLGEDRDIRTFLGPEAELRCSPEMVGIKTTLTNRSWIVNVLPPTPGNIMIFCEIVAPGFVSSGTFIRLRANGALRVTGYTIDVKHQAPLTAPPQP